MLYAFLLPAVVLALLFVPVVVAIKKKKGEQSLKKAFAANICSFFAVMLICAALPFGMKAYAESAPDTTAATSVSDEADAEDSSSDTSGLLYIASALAVGLGAIGGGIAIAAAAPAAIGAVSENPKTFSNALIFAALGEACALYGFVVALLMLFI